MTTYQQPPCQSLETKENGRFPPCTPPPSRRFRRFRHPVVDFTTMASDSTVRFRTFPLSTAGQTAPPSVTPPRLPRIPHPV